MASFLMGYIPFVGTCVVMMMSISMAWSACTVTEFGSSRKFANYTFDTGQPGSLRAKVSGKDPVMDSAYWKKGDLTYSQDSVIIANYAKNFTIKDDTTTGLYELVFKNNLTSGDAGVYKCSCGNDFEVAVFVNSGCCQGTVTINNETSKSLPGFIKVTSESATTEVYQVDFDAGSVYPDVDSLYASWTCNTCENKAGEPASWERTVPVTTQPDLGKIFNGVYTVFNYKGVTACFDLIAEGNGQNMMRNGCIAINATSYDTCLIRVSYNTCNVTIVDYSKDCPTPRPPVLPGCPVSILITSIVVGVLHLICIIALVVAAACARERLFRPRSAYISEKNKGGNDEANSSMSRKTSGQHESCHCPKPFLIVVTLLQILGVIALSVVTPVEFWKCVGEVWIIPVAVVLIFVGLTIIAVAVMILVRIKNESCPVSECAPQSVPMDGKQGISNSACENNATA